MAGGLGGVNIDVLQLTMKVVAFQSITNFYTIA